MQNIVGLKEFRAAVPGIASKVARGEIFIVVKRSKPLFKVSPVDEEGVWQTVVDFTKIRKGGVDIKDILKRL